MIVFVVELSIVVCKLFGYFEIWLCPGYIRNDADGIAIEIFNSCFWYFKENYLSVLISLMFTNAGKVKCDKWVFG